MQIVFDAWPDAIRTTDVKEKTPFDYGVWAGAPREELAAHRKAMTAVDLCTSHLLEGPNPDVALFAEWFDATDELHKTDLINEFSAIGLKARIPQEVVDQLNQAANQIRKY